MRLFDTLADFDIKALKALQAFVCMKGVFCLHLGEDGDFSEPSATNQVAEASGKWNWLVVWIIFYFPIYWESSSQLTNVFQRG